MERMGGIVKLVTCLAAVVCFLSLLSGVWIVFGYSIAVAWFGFVAIWIGKMLDEILYRVEKIEENRRSELASDGKGMAEH